jgi:hypothetical protein
MNIDFGLAVVLAAGLFFYLRVIILQREKAKRVRQELEAARKQKPKKGAPPAPRPSYSIVSRNPVDLAIAGAGGIAIIVGALLNSNTLQLAALQPYWWAIMALGFIGFGWAFKL